MSDQWQSHGSDINAYQNPETPDSQTNALNALGTMPVFGGMLKGMADNLTGIGEGDGMDIAGGVIGAVASVGDFGLKVADMQGKLIDSSGSPLSWLGANFIIDVLLTYIEPLDDLLKQVSGDAEAMQKQIEEWEKVKVALGELSGEIATKSAEALKSWSGQAAQAAAQSVAALTATVDGLSGRSDTIQRTLAWAQAMANLIYEVIKGILAGVLEELLIAGAAALAATGPSFGASWSAFLLWAVKAILKAIVKALKKIFTTRTGFDILTGALLGGAVSATAGGAKTLFSEAFDSSGNAGQVQASIDVGLAADLNEFTTQKANFDTQSSHASDIKTVIDNTAAAEMTWGICGLFFEGSYSDATSTFGSDVEFVSITLKDHGDKMAEVEQAYHDTDRTISDDLHAVWNDQ
ncbi:hypothetical protein [Glycomyces arizonensis]|uniref:hypothetical protein n=1 Tax=Glycomyces arizonensis TaxID=256035 RepID=UPI00041CB025|nr:hypothetical protein [Glycomyces arizonensis]